ncbi:hypothetical protein KMZ14_10280 [Acinetobacter schindleri]|uniref:hypothetical protein n=1 Tax=Acinetobacter schindleri TaxID=108981 RepID=UPI00236210D8|nr:hypothetical protein [Acinetobacter schindleri]WDE15141.1 hypothetical protein KMZ14_10280 [Acinetobacter schindleri]
MTVMELTEEQFTTLAEVAVKVNSINSTSMTVLKSTMGIIIQSVSGEYLLVSE